MKQRAEEHKYQEGVFLGQSYIYTSYPSTYLRLCSVSFVRPSLTLCYPIPCSFLRFTSNCIIRFTLNTPILLILLTTLSSSCISTNLQRRGRCGGCCRRRRVKRSRKQSDQLHRQNVPHRQLPNVSIRSGHSQVNSRGFQRRRGSHSNELQIEASGGRAEQKPPKPPSLGKDVATNDVRGPSKTSQVT